MRSESRSINYSEALTLSEKIHNSEVAIRKKLNWTAIIILLALIVFSIIHIYYYDKSNWSLLSKFMVSICPIVIWGMVEDKYKNRKKIIEALQKLKEIEKSGMINVIVISARRVVKFEEKGDEGAFYLIETKEGQCIYLLDDQYLLEGQECFPCDIFEVYSDKDLKYVMDNKVYCLGEKIVPMIVAGKEKLEYFRKRGFPLDMEMEVKPLDKLMDEIGIAPGFSPGARF